MKYSKANAYRAKHKRCRYCIYCKKSYHDTMLSDMFGADTHECIVKNCHWSNVWFNGLRGAFCSVFEPEFLEEVTQKEKTS